MENSFWSNRMDALTCGSSIMAPIYFNQETFLYICITYAFTDFKYSNKESCMNFFTFLSFLFANLMFLIILIEKKLTQLTEKDYITQMKN